MIFKNCINYFFNENNIKTKKEKELHDKLDSDEFQIKLIYYKNSCGRILGEYKGEVECVVSISNQWKMDDWFEYKHHNDIYNKTKKQYSYFAYNGYIYVIYYDNGHNKQFIRYLEQLGKKEMEKIKEKSKIKWEKIRKKEIKKQSGGLLITSV